MLRLLLFILTSSAWAGNPIPGLPGNGGLTAGTSIGTSSGSFSGASNQGVSNNLSIGGSPGHQVVENVPGLGSQFANNVSSCSMAVSAQGVGMGGGGGASVPFKDLDCVMGQKVTNTASVAVALVNAGTMVHDERAINDGLAGIGDALDLSQCSDPNSFLVRKAKGRPCPIEPDRTLTDRLSPGGIIAQHVKMAPDYKPYVPPKPVYTPPPAPAYNPNPALDKVFEDQMSK